jgi:hypothetical protein
MMAESGNDDHPLGKLVASICSSLKAGA